MRPVIGLLCGLSDGDPDSSSGRDSLPRAYGEAVTASGGTPVLLPCTEDETAVKHALSLCNGIIITGGVDLDPRYYGAESHGKMGAISPERDMLDRGVLIHLAANPHVPLLGICRGIQSMNALAGGTLIQDIPSQVAGAILHSQKAPRWYGTHEINPERGSRLAAIVGPEPLRVNSFHHQAVDRVADGYVAVARTSDGVIEAIERPDREFCIGVQFHPELMASREPRIRLLFDELVRVASGITTQPNP